MWKWFCLMISSETGKKKMSALVLAAIGVVYGDIGTSPLYALKECFSAEHGVPMTPGSVFGVLSLLFWAIFIVVSLKYLIFILRADNKGEGGILALMALALRGVDRERSRWWIAGFGMFGAAMFYGDGMITPAISVLSAVEGLAIATPWFSNYILPITVAIICALFFFQKHGTAAIGKLFGPITCVWFAILAILGIHHIVQAPEILAAVNPYYGFHFALEHRWQAFIVLGSVFLAVTGTEALYADMGHFGSRAIRLAWFWFVMPALLLNYFGQGALILNSPESISNPFYLMAPSWGVLPLVLLAQVPHINAKVMTVLGIAGPPYIPQQLRVREHFSGVADQRRQQFVLDRGQVNQLFLVRNLALQEVDGDIAETEHRRDRIHRFARTSAQVNTNAGHHFRYAKWLGQIIVGAGIECAHLLHFFATGRQDKDRYG